jgi:hypothetical protein
VVLSFFIDEPVNCIRPSRTRPESFITLCVTNKRGHLYAAGIATGYGPDDWGVGVRVSVGSRTLSSPRRPDRLWGPTSFLYNGYRGLSGQGVKVTTHLQLVPRSRKCGSIFPLPHTPSWPGAWLVKHRDNFTFYSLQHSAFWESNSRSASQ